MNYDLPKDDPKAWGPIMKPGAKGTTTLIGDTLEKKGLMQWPKGVALRELFGFYDSFKTDDGDEIPAGFSKGVGTIWEMNPGDGDYKEQILEMVISASKGWQRKQKKGADIGSVVHDAIEHHVKGLPFDIAEQYMWSIKDQEYESEALRDKALEEFEEDVAQAKLAFDQFVTWWAEKKPKLLGAEDLVYSKKHHVCGTFDGLIEIDGKVILADWKTSKASKSKAAAMPEGISYDYFVQSAIYAMAWHEMGNDLVDDLMVVSCRKDGGFTTISASELGLTVEDCINWARAVIIAYRMREKTRAGLIAHAEVNNKENKYE